MKISVTLKQYEHLNENKMQLLTKSYDLKEDETVMQLMKRIKSVNSFFSPIDVVELRMMDTVLEDLEEMDRKREKIEPSEI